LIHQKGIFKIKVQETKKIIVICIKRLLLMNLTPGVVVTAVVTPVVGAVVDVVSSTTTDEFVDEFVWVVDGGSVE
jgi:hypothetical protein